MNDSSWQFLGETTILCDLLYPKFDKNSKRQFQLSTLIFDFLTSPDFLTYACWQKLSFRQNCFSIDISFDTNVLLPTSDFFHYHYIGIIWAEKISTSRKISVGQTDTCGRKFSLKLHSDFKKIFFLSF